MLKFATGYATQKLVELNDREIHISHCGTLWIEFWTTPEIKASLSFASEAWCES